MPATLRGAAPTLPIRFTAVFCRLPSARAAAATRVPLHVVAAPFPLALPMARFAAPLPPAGSAAFSSCASSVPVGPRPCALNKRGERMDELDFNGPWRDDLMQQQTAKFLSAQTHAEQRAAADLIMHLRSWKERAEAAK